MMAPNNADANSKVRLRDKQAESFDGAAGVEVAVEPVSVGCDICPEIAVVSDRGLDVRPAEGSVVLEAEDVVTAAQIDLASDCCVDQRSLRSTGFWYGGSMLYHLSCWVVMSTTADLCCTKHELTGVDVPPPLILSPFFAVVWKQTPY